MPKIVSSSTVSSSDHGEGRPEKHLHVFYCLCSEFILVIDADLEKLPRRATDKSFIVANARHTYKLNATDGTPVLLRRSNGYEKQYRMHCPRCNLLIAYEITPKRRGGQYTYIVEGSLTRDQGVVPPDALDD